MNPLRTIEPPFSYETSFPFVVNDLIIALIQSINEYDNYKSFIFCFKQCLFEINSVQKKELNYEFFKHLLLINICSHLCSVTYEMRFDEIRIRRGIAKLSAYFYDLSFMVKLMGDGVRK